MGNVLITSIKSIAAILLLPISIACFLVFQKHLSEYPSIYKDFFLWGTFSFILTYIFIYQFWGIYTFGQKIIQGIFKFVAPLDRVFSYFFPFYLIIIMSGFYITKNFFNFSKYDIYFIFFAGFSLTMHVILTAQDLQDQERIIFKPDYFFLINIIFVFNVFFVILFSDFVIRKFTVQNFFTSLIQEAGQIYNNCFNLVL